MKITPRAASRMLVINFWSVPARCLSIQLQSASYLLGVYAETLKLYGLR